MDDSFSGVRLKLSRALNEVNALDKEVIQFLESSPSPYDLCMQFDKDSRIFTFAIRITKAPDPMWGIRIGEVIHNLRSALDHIVWELVILTTGRTPAPSTKNQFPIFETKEGFNKRGVDQFLQCVHTRAVNLIRSEQPYFTGEGRESPLWHLQELSNADKHRTICVVGTLVQQFRLRMPVTTDGSELEELESSLQPGPIKQDTVLFRGRVVGGYLPWPFAHDQVDGDLAPNIAFDQSTPTVGGWLAMHTLMNIQARVERVASRIAKEIFQIDLGPIR